MRRRRRLRRRGAWASDFIEEDPGAGLLNLFDVWIAFAVALLLAMVSYMKLPELMSARGAFTLVANPGSTNMEIIRKDGRKIERFRATTEELTGQGERLGTAYRLSSGEVVYVPDPAGGKTTAK
jgi:hypothetical protein